MIARTAKRKKEDHAEAVAEIFKTLSDPTRLRILMRLAVGETCVHELKPAGVKNADGDSLLHPVAYYTLN